MLAAMFDNLRDTRTLEEKPERDEIIEQIELVKKQIKLVDQLFNLSEDSHLTEACIYQSKAFWAYYTYLVGLVKALPVAQAAPATAPQMGAVAARLRQALGLGA